MDNRVVLDDKSFKALSADSRVSILKKLKERRMTLSELSERLKLKNSTVKEHCSILQNAELIAKIDEGRKWKYYELTGKGKQVIEPSLFEEAKVFVMLSLTAILFFGFFLVIIQNAFLNNSYLTAPIQESSMIMQVNDNEYLTTKATDLTIDSSLDATSFNINYNIFSISLITILVFGIFIGWIVGRRVN